ncbi:hypothetical protein JCM13304A_09470 [Desulfothermus okinawensis JCM 13304]
MKITVSGFGNLFFQLKKLHGAAVNLSMDIPDKSSVKDVISTLGLKLDDIEGVFINGEVKPISSKLKKGDRIGLIPRGVPGPYRFLLGIKKLKN